MEGFAQWIANISWPVVSRVLVAMGFGTVTYTGADTALHAALGAAKAAIGGIGADVAALLAMAGFFDFMAITSGGLVAGLSWLVLKRFALQTTGGAA